MAWLLAGAIALPAQLPPVHHPHSMEIIGHRGASHDAPENTVAAARLAFEQKADATELDIWLTKDGKLAVIHDDNTKRTTGIPGKVKEMTLADLRELDAGSWKHARFAREKIPSLEEVLAVVPPGKKVVIEIKNKDKAIVAPLKAALELAKAAPAGVILISFDAGVLKLAKEQLPAYPALFLCSYKQDAETGKATPDLETLIQGAQAAKFQGLNLSAKWPLDAALVKKVHEAGLKLYVWTVNDAAMARRLKEAGVDGLTTDRPAWLREQTQ